MNRKDLQEQIKYIKSLKTHKDLNINVEKIDALIKNIKELLDEIDYYA